MGNETTETGVQLLAYFPNVLTFLGAVIVAFITGWFAYRTSRSTERASTSKAQSEARQAERRDTIEDRDSLIAILGAQVTELRSRMDKVESDFEEVRTHNFSLVNFALRCIGVFQRLGLEHEIPQPLPKGVDL